MNKKHNKYTIAIIIVSVLLAITLALLLAVLFGHSGDHSVSKNNVIGNEPETNVNDTRAPLPQISGSLNSQPVYFRSLLFSSKQSDKLTLSWWTGYDGEKTFSVSDMMPGDSASKEYKITVRSQNAVSLIFETEIISNSALADVLIIKVEADGTLLYNGSVADMRKLSYELSNRTTTKEITYKITVSLPTTAGNKYAGLSLTVDFLWSLAENEPKPPVTTEPEPPETIGPEPPETTEPESPETTEPEPPVTTEPEPPVTTGPDDPIINPGEHDECCDCLICGFIVRIFLGRDCVRCLICRIVTALLHSDTFICICPWCCIIVLILLIIILAIILWLLLRKRREEEQEDEEGAEQSEAQEGASAPDDKDEGSGGGQI